MQQVISNKNIDADRSTAAGSSLVDPWMCRRFSISCMLICSYLGYLFYYSTVGYKTVLQNAQEPGPNFSVHSTIATWVEFIPQVTLSMVGFLLFGTTTLAIGNYKAAAQSVFGRPHDHGDQREIPVSSPVHATPAVASFGSVTDDEKELYPSVAEVTMDV